MQNEVISTGNGSEGQSNGKSVLRFFGMGGSQNDTDLGRDVVVVHKPDSSRARAIRALRAQLALGGEIETLAVVSLSGGDGRSYVASNLAVSFAASGKRTLLIDTDLNSPRQHSIFGLGEPDGLSQVLSHQMVPNSGVLSVPSVPNLWVLPAGETSVSADELIARAETDKILRTITEPFDLVIFDTPPGVESIVPDWIANFCGHAILVIRRNKSRLDAVRKFSERLSSRANVLGAVLNEQ